MLTGLKVTRERRGWTQRELAEKARVSVSAITRAEQGRSGTREDVLVKIADALQVSADELLGRVR